MDARTRISLSRRESDFLDSFPPNQPVVQSDPKDLSMRESVVGSSKNLIAKTKYPPKDSSGGDRLKVQLMGFMRKLKIRSRAPSDMSSVSTGSSVTGTIRADRKPVASGSSAHHRSTYSPEFIESQYPPLSNSQSLIESSIEQNTAYKTTVPTLPPSPISSDASRSEPPTDVHQYSTPSLSSASLDSSKNRFLTAPPIHLLSMNTAADLQRGIFDLCWQTRLAQGFSDKLVIVQETLVQEVMEYLQMELDSTTHLKSNTHHAVFGTTGVYYKRCLRTLRQLSVIYKVFPSSLVIQNVKQDGRHAVGGGGFADIYRGTVGERRVCLKVLRLVMEQDEEIRDKIRKEFCNEALIWRQLQHPNILPLLGINVELFSPSFCLISPWMENKDIITFLRKNPTHDRRRVLSEVAAGLSYLHSRDPPILHGDIRGANILVSDDFRCCLADFGLTLVISDSRTFSNATTSAMTKGTTRWMAPELIILHNSAKPATHHTSRDIYAFGCTVLEILTLQIPFHDKTTDPAIIYSLMLGERPARPQNVWYPDRIWDLTTRCWTEQPASRPTAQEISDFLQIALTDLSSSTSLNQEETIIGVSGLDSSDLDSLAESSQSAELEPPELQRGRSFAYRSWATWQPDPNLMPTPPSSEESLIVLSLRSRHDSIESLALPAWAQIHPGGERRETIRTAISMLWKEMSTPPEYMRQTDSGKRDWDGVELRMARLSTCIEASSMPGDRQVEVIFSKALQDGFVLCMLMNKLRSSPIIQPDSDSNITKFLAACSSYGLPNEDLFQQDDLIKSSPKSLARVAKTIIVLIEFTGKSESSSIAAPRSGSMLSTVSRPHDSEASPIVPNDSNIGASTSVDSISFLRKSLVIPKP